MKISEATKMVQEMIDKHIPGAVFDGYTSSRKTLGLAGFHGTKQFIKLSQPFVKIASKSEVFDTVAHEVAHLLAYRNFGTLAHDKHFYDMCKIVGAKPERLASNKSETSEKLSSMSKYRLILADENGQVKRVLTNTYDRRPRRNLTRLILNSDKNTLGKLWYCETRNAKVGLKITPEKFWQF